MSYQQVIHNMMWKAFKIGKNKATTNTNLVNAIADV